jgi:hypothetical protein
MLRRYEIYDADTIDFRFLNSGRQELLHRRGFDFTLTLHSCSRTYAVRLGNDAAMRSQDSMTAP